MPGQGLRKNPERWKSEDWKDDWGEPIADVKKRNVEALKNFGFSYYRFEKLSFN